MDSEIIAPSVLSLQHIPLGVSCQAVKDLLTLQYSQIRASIRETVSKIEWYKLVTMSDGITPNVEAFGPTPDEVSSKIESLRAKLGHLKRGYSFISAIRWLLFRNNQNMIAMDGTDLSDEKVLAEGLDAPCTGGTSCFCIRCAILNPITTLFSKNVEASSYTYDHSISGLAYSREEEVLNTNLIGLASLMVDLPDPGDDYSSSQEMISAQTADNMIAFFNDI